MDQSAKNMCCLKASLKCFLSEWVAMWVPQAGCVGERVLIIESSKVWASQGDSNKVK